MKRPSYKKLYLQEKARREMYERWEPTLVIKHEEYSRKVDHLCKDIEKSALAARIGGDRPGVMQGLSGWIATKRESDTWKPAAD